jgi:hypothetical protein
MRDIDGIDVLIEHLRDQQQKARAGRADSIVKPPVAAGDELPPDEELSELEALLAAEGGAPVGVIDEEDEDELEK